MKYFPVNWIDGMKINKDHFIDEQKAFSFADHQISHLGISEYNFGLIKPDSVSNDSPFKIWIDVENDNSIHVKLSRCYAVTTSGIVIDINDTHQDNHHFAIPTLSLKERASNLQEGLYYIAVSVNPFKRVPFGTVDPQEEPPRYPYTSPEYSIAILPSSSNANPGGNVLFIGKIKIQEGVIFVQDDYIPPSRAINSHPALLDIHASFNNLLGKLETTVLLIIQKILQKDQQYPLAQLVQVIAEQIIYFLSNQMFRFRQIVKAQAPIEMVSVLSQLGRTIKNTIDIYQGTGKEELLTYFVEWCDLNQAQFEGVLSEVVNIDYKHTDIRISMDRCQRFLKEVVTLFQKLSELDYIGKKTEKTILVKEEQVRKDPPTRTRISFFER